jgi:hypothetical protein
LVTSESAETFAKAREAVAATVRRVGPGRFAPVVHYTPVLLHLRAKIGAVMVGSRAQVRSRDAIAAKRERSGATSGFRAAAIN